MPSQDSEWPHELSKRGKLKCRQNPRWNRRTSTLYLTRSIRATEREFTNFLSGRESHKESIQSVSNNKLSKVIFKFDKYALSLDIRLWGDWLYRTSWFMLQSSINLLFSHDMRRRHQNCWHIKKHFGTHRLAEFDRNPDCLIYCTYSYVYIYWHIEQLREISGRFSHPLALNSSGEKIRA